MKDTKAVDMFSEAVKGFTQVPYDYDRTLQDIFSKMLKTEGVVEWLRRTLQQRAEKQQTSLDSVECQMKLNMECEKAREDLKAIFYARGLERYTKNHGKDSFVAEIMAAIEKDGKAVVQEYKQGYENSL